MSAGLVAEANDASVHPGETDWGRSGLEMSRELHPAASTAANSKLKVALVSLPEDTSEQE
jgi:hypothetical protein